MVRENNNNDCTREGGQSTHSGVLFKGTSVRPRGSPVVGMMEISCDGNAFHGERHAKAVVLFGLKAPWV